MKTSNYIVLFVIIVSSFAYDNKWSDKQKVSKRIKRIKQKLDNFKQLAILSRKICTAQMNNCYDDTNLESELSMHKENGCVQTKKSVYLYFISCVGVLLIILIFYFHITYPEHYLPQHKDQ